MFLRWMVRPRKKRRRFWHLEKPFSQYLSIPLDVHTANISRKLGNSHQNSKRLESRRRTRPNHQKIQSEDPAVYDYALFGIGVSKELL